MKCTRLLVPLTLLALAAPTRADETTDLLQRVAALGLVEQVLAGNPFLEDWDRAVLGETWLYHDPTGKPLFYEVGVAVDGAPAGRVKVGADPRLGTTLLSVESTPRAWTVFDGVFLSAFLIQAAHPQAELLAAFLVGYNGLSSGVVIFFDDPENPGLQFEVYDLDTLQLVPVEHIRSSLASIPPEQYADRWQGFYEDVDHAIVVGDALLEQGVELRDVFIEPLSPFVWDVLQQVPGSLLTTEPHITVDINRCKLYLQEENDWCARASLQMFNHFHTGGPIHTQTQIDNLLNSFGWDANWTFSMDVYLGFYPMLNDTGFQAIPQTATPATTWTALTAEIDTNLPFGLYSGGSSDAHFGMTVGYQVTTKQLAGASIFGDVKEYWLHVFDPAIGIISAKAWRGTAMTYLGGIDGYYTVRP